MGRNSSYWALVSPVLSLCPGTLVPGQYNKVESFQEKF